MRALSTQVHANHPDFQERYSQMQAVLEQFHQRMEESRSQGPEKYQQRHQAAGKLLARDRIELLLDPHSPFLELMPLAGYGQDQMTLGGSVVAGIGVVSGTECVIHANVPTIKGGAMNHITVLKGQRLDVIADENALPTIYLTESAGADLLQQSQVFNIGGAAFREITRRSKKGIPSLTVVFGSCTAGGAYVPGMSDYVVMVKEQAKAFLAGPPLVKMATGEVIDDESLGGAEMHAKASGLCDYLANNETEAIHMARDIVSNLNYSKSSSLPQYDVRPPLYDAEELLGIVSPDTKRPFDIREVIARLVDGSEFSEFKPLYGNTLVTGFARIHGVMVGILGNNGVLFSESANKATQFIQLCNQQNCPLVFLQNITGFMVGQRYEEGGIIRNGARLINAIANCEVPAITVVVGASYGAGNYGMFGRSFLPRFLFTWPNSKLAVMGSEQLVGVMEMLQREKAQKAGVPIDEAVAAQLRQNLTQQLDQEADAYYGTSRVWDDGIIDPRDTRNVLGLCLSAIHSAKVEGSKNYGVFR